MEHKKSFSRTLALLLTLCLLLGLAPTAAFAAESPAEDAPAVELTPVKLAPAEPPALPMGEGDPLPVVPYGTWDHAAVLQTNPPAAVQFTLDTYENDITANQIWVAVSTEEDNQGIELTFANLAIDVRVTIYTGSTLETEGVEDNNYSYYRYLRNDTFAWQAPNAGAYYILIRPRYSNTTTDVAASVQARLIDGDFNECNNTWETAAELTENVSTYFNLSGVDDVDWFKITTPETPGDAIKLMFNGFDYTVPDLSMYLFKEEDCQDGHHVWSVSYFRSTMTTSYKFDEPGVYYLKIHTRNSSDYMEKSIRLNYQIIPGDEHEINDSYDTATPLAFESPVQFTLNGQNDEDWFCFETGKPNEVVRLYLSGFETDYSNNIRYLVFDAAYDGITGDQTGYDDDVLYYANYVTMTHSREMTFANTGRHYLCIFRQEGQAVENPLTLRLVGGVSDAAEPNDTWQEAVYLSEGSPAVFNLSTNDTDWFRFTSTKPYQTVELHVELPVSGGSSHLYLFSGTDFEIYGNNAGAMKGWSYLSKTSVMRWRLGAAGDYYLRLTPASTFEEDATISFLLIDPDDNESNDSWKNATMLNPEEASAFTFPASNDAEYFRFDVSDPDQTVQLDLDIPAGGSVHVYLYSGENYRLDGDNANSLKGWTYLSGKCSARWMLDGEGDYYVRVTPYNIFDEEATISYSLIEPDVHERNDTWKTASALNEGVTTGFTLPADNDVDWFRVDTARDDQTIQMDFDIPAGGEIHIYLYSGARFQAEGDNADSIGSWTYRNGKFSIRSKVDEAGDYYFRITRSHIFDQDASVSFQLFEPDAYENNQDIDIASEIPQNTVTRFTLPAPNDNDWFYLGHLTSGDTVKVTYGSGRPISLYRTGIRIRDDNSQGENFMSGYISNTATTDTFTVDTDGEYYYGFHSYNSTWTDQEMWFKYAIIRDDMPVTGISDITNKETNIPVGYVLQLSAHVLPTSATNQTILWTSTNETVATIDADGFLTALAEGTTTIYATTEEGSYQKSCTITVVKATPVESVSITIEKNTQNEGYSAEKPKHLALNTSLQLTAVFNPLGATNQNVTWSSSDEKVVQINRHGKVFALGSGSAVITVTTEDGGKTANFYINVPDETFPVRSLTLNYNVYTLYMGEGEGFDLAVTVNPSYATNKDVVWSSSNESVATVDANGHVKQVGVGDVTITVCAAENSGVKTTCAVKVKPARTRVTGISFEETEVELGLYGSMTLVPIIAPTNATDKDVAWTTDNKNIATVSRQGVVTALNLGNVTITATTKDGSFTASVLIHVRATATCGDLNNDGAVDSGDALLVLRASVGLIVLSDAQKSVADVNGDGEIDAGDAVLILRYDAGLIEEFPKK